MCEEGVRKARAAYEARGARGEEFLATLYRKGDINDADLVAILGTPKSFRSFSAYSRTTLTHVYFGVQGGTKKYVGIAIDVGSRELQHGSRFQQLLPITRVAIPRSHARAIEQALILRHGHISRSGRVVGQGEFLNLINSIGPGREPLFQDAVEWGQKWLRITGN